MNQELTPGDLVYLADYKNVEILEGTILEEDIAEEDEEEKRYKVIFRNVENNNKYCCKTFEESNIHKDIQTAVSELTLRLKSKISPWKNRVIWL